MVLCIHFRQAIIRRQRPRIGLCSGLPRKSEKFATYQANGICRPYLFILILKQVCVSLFPLLFTMNSMYDDYVFTRNTSRITRFWSQLTTYWNAQLEVERGPIGVLRLLTFTDLPFTRLPRPPRRR
jgi:hypothetical protein